MVFAHFIAVIKILVVLPDWAGSLNILPT